MGSKIEVKASDLIGPALDWAVAKACGFKLRHQARDGHRAGGYHAVGDAYGYIWTDTEPDGCPGSPYCWSPSRCWKNGGPLIEKYAILFMGEQGFDEPDVFFAIIRNLGAVGRGETHLIAACRAIVAAKLGDTVSVPAELVGGEK